MTTVVPVPVSAVHAAPVRPVLTPGSSVRPTRALIDLDAFRSNLDFVRRCVGPRVGIMAVVKADAYGHGMVAIAREAWKWGVQAFAVATVDEALTLRETRSLGEVPILLAGPSFPEDARLLQEADISTAIGNHELLQTHLALAHRRGVAPKLHVKIDTGMGRLGFRAEDMRWLESFRGPARDALEGLFTHFSVSDSLDPDDLAYTRWQRARFDRVRRLVDHAGLRPVVHSSNSGAVLHHRNCHDELVRPGILLYGAHPDPGGTTLPLRPVMTLATRIVSIHDHPEGACIGYGRTYRMPSNGRVAILPIGYGDGVPRALGNHQGQVLIRGVRCPIAGRICMDQMLVDVTSLPEARVGDEVVLYGEQGGERISLEEVARRVGSIAYEITCQLGLRVPREVLDSGSR